MSIPDPLEEIRTLLLADTAVAAIADTNVFGGELKESVRAEMPQAAVVLVAAGGPGRLGRNLYRRTRLTTLCYGETIAKATGLHFAVREVLETMDRPTGTLFSAEVSSDGSTARDPLTQWPVSIASYLVMSATDP